MTKEELKKEFEKYLKDSSDYYDPREPLTERKLLQMWLDCAEPREKRIADLEEKLANADYQLEGRDNEIKELKDYRLTTLAKQQTDMSKYALNLEHKLSWYDNQLTKAKEIIEGLMRFCRCFAQHHTEDIRYKEAEQFLKEE